MNILSPAPSPAPRSVLASLHELLRSPHDLLERARGATEPPSRSAGRLVVGSALLVAVYGAAAGLFQGGAQVAVAAFKAPAIVLLSIVVCLPSLYVFATLAGADLSARAFAVTAAGFSGVLALLLSSFLPIAWLFSVGTGSLLFITWIHLLAWAAALVFASRFLRLALPGDALRRPLSLWVLLVALVSLQMATTLRPVLYRPVGGPLVEREKRLFLEQLQHVGRMDEQAAKAHDDRPEPGLAERPPAPTR